MIPLSTNNTTIKNYWIKGEN